VKRIVLSRKPVARCDTRSTTALDAAAGKESEMSEAREKRNAEIREQYERLRRVRGLTSDNAIDAIFCSKENKAWCLKRDTIKLIAVWKNYGKQKHNGTYSKT